MIYRLYNADTLNRYAKDCHQRAVAKGFWDEANTYYHYLMLAFGELHEGIEADRIGRWAKLTPEQIKALRQITKEVPLSDTAQTAIYNVIGGDWEEAIEAIARLKSERNEQN